MSPAVFPEFLTCFLSFWRTIGEVVTDVDGKLSLFFPHCYAPYSELCAPDMLDLQF
jgi:hypothetical protein